MITMEQKQVDNNSPSHGLILNTLTSDLDSDNSSSSSNEYESQ